jgi:hypothetical protein
MESAQRSKGAKPKEKINPHIRARSLLFSIINILKIEGVLRKLN